jgi:Kef-type K+ transport system membrane component KefB
MFERRVLMPLEEEVLALLIGWFSVVIGIAILALLFLWSKNKNDSPAYLWTLSHLLLVSVAVYFFIKAISFDYKHVMASEENSLQIAIAGIIWAFSMGCLIMGIYKFSISGKVISP